MPILNSYYKYKPKKDFRKKDKEKDVRINDNFIIDNSDDYGIVIEVKYDSALVLYHDEIISASFDRKLELVCNQTIYPGDKVVIVKNNDNYIMSNLIKRNTILSRNKRDYSKINDIGHTKYIATNVDLAVIVVSACEPPLHPKFIDRYLMILEDSNIPAIICLNKCELKSDKEDKILQVYRKLNIPVIETSTINNIGIDELKTYLLNKRAIFIGHSGVGKSSLTNAIMNDEETETGHISEKSRRGRHTTKSSKYYIWNDNSSIIDTPGIRSLDVSSFDKNEVQDYFHEFDPYKNHCKYNNCLHYHEPADSCIVKQSVKDGLINKDRYESYLRIMSDILGENNYENIINELVK